MQPTDIHIPNYEIKQRLGRGGMASVFLARHIPGKRMVALKLMSDALGEESMWAKRFIQEAQVIAQLSHPNVVPIHDVGSHDGQFYIAMALLKGGSLKDRMQDAISIPDALKIVAGVAAGLDYAAEKGFVHRDIKPDNIMFSKDGKPVILDFGIVKNMDTGSSKMTQTGMVIGTVAYMSPEQAQGHTLDQRSDIYSLGVMFYELLTGEQPYIGDTDVSTILKHISDPIPLLPQPLRVFQPLIEQCLAKTPDERYTRAREIIENIKTLEPNIRDALKKMHASNTSNSSAPTQVSSVVDDTNIHDEATQVFYAREDGDGEDITKVLSSAQATIRDFSVDARQRKAKRARYTLGAAAAVAISASVYLGYHQLVVIPKEREAAEAIVREAELKTERKIAALLDEAGAMKKGIELSKLEQVDGLIAIYRQVLKLDPEHEQTALYLTNLGERYIALAEVAVNRGDIEKADTYRTYADSLVPNHSDLSALRQEIKRKQAQDIEARMVSDEVATLLDIAAKEIKAVQGFSDLAYTKIQQILRISPQHIKAQTLLSHMYENTYSRAERDITQNKFSSARTHISILEKHYPDKSKVALLRKKMNSTASASQKKRQATELLSRASQLVREKRTLVVNDQLRSVYKQIRVLSPESIEAKKGLIETSDFEAKLARIAIAENDFKRAQKNIDAIVETSPNYQDLAELRRQLMSRQKAVFDANNIVAAAARDLGNASALLGEPESHRSLLTQVSEKLKQAKDLDKSNKKIGARTEELEDAYVSAITKHMAKKRYNIAETYLKDVEGLSWPSTRLPSLYADFEKKSKKKKKDHVMTTGF